MNLLDYKTTPMHVVMAEIEKEASEKGIEIANSEIIGLVPLDALLDTAYARLKLEGFQRERILDLIV